MSRQPTNADHLRIALASLNEARHRLFAADRSPGRDVAGTFVDQAKNQVNLLLMDAVKSDPIEDEK